jgi:hypothetical protein
LLIDSNLSVFYPFLQPGSGIVGKQMHQNQVQPFAGQGFRYLSANMFFCDALRVARFYGFDKPFLVIVMCVLLPALRRL